MPPDAEAVARAVSRETGLTFEGRAGRDDGGTWIELHPAGHLAAETFIIRTAIGWRRLDITFDPGAFAQELIAEMGRADTIGRALLGAVLTDCRDDGAAVELEINGAPADPADDAIWSTEWTSVKLAVRRGMLPINAGDDAGDMRLVQGWTGRVAAAVTALLPLEEQIEDAPLPDVEGLPEGARIRIEVNRYERDRRNRAAALAIHGYCCKACRLDMELVYGSDAAGLIEVHHVTPVSELGPDYIIDPATDLVPLCPNCHSVAHRRKPPFSVEEIAAMLAARLPAAGEAE